MRHHGMVEIFDGGVEREAGENTSRRIGPNTFIYDEITYTTFWGYVSVRTYKGRTECDKVPIN